MVGQTALTALLGKKPITVRGHFLTLHVLLRKLKVLVVAFLEAGNEWLVRCAKGWLLGLPQSLFNMQVSVSACANAKQ